MTLLQLAQVRHWLRLHGRAHPVELCAWDLVLMSWLIGWMGTPVFMLIDAFDLLPLSLAGFLLPSLYAAWRTRLHRMGRLRCDWLTAL